MIQNYEGVNGTAWEKAERPLGGETSGSVYNAWGDATVCVFAGGERTLGKLNRVCA